MTVRYTNLPDNKDKPFGGAYSVHDDETVVEMDNLIYEFTQEDHNHDAIRESFIETYKWWMPSTHNLIGIEKYTEGCFTQGTTESFAQFYIRYRNHKRLRLAKGEYFYHQMMRGLWYEDSFAWLDEDDIRDGDVVLLSVPFSDTGDVPYALDELLDECDKNNVHVMLDLAYINLAVDLEINLEHPCIQYVVSSLSKVFPVENMRIGIRLQREKFEDQLYVVNEPGYNYINLLSAYVGKEMMLEFPADFIYDKYAEDQEVYCKYFDLVKSSCVYFGIDHNNKYPEYSRGNETNRLCFSRIWDSRQYDNFRL
jgi:hypothetical protein